MGDGGGGRGERRENCGWDIIYVRVTKKCGEQTLIPNQKCMKVQKGKDELCNVYPNTDL